jgi:hypothetical protein
VAQRPYGRVLARLITEAHRDPQFAQEYQARFLQPRRDAGREVFRRAIGRGELMPDVDVEVALDLLYGPLYHRLLHAHAQFNARFARQVVDTVLSGILARPAGE